MQAKWLLGAVKVGGREKKGERRKETEEGGGEHSMLALVGCARYVSNANPSSPINWVATAAVQRSHDDVDVAAAVVAVVVALLCPCVSVSAAHIVGRR